MCVTAPFYDSASHRRQLGGDVYDVSLSDRALPYAVDDLWRVDHLVSCRP